MLAQTHSNLELVISDNASTDGTQEICRRFAREDRRVVYQRQATNVGLLNNFISAAENAAGTYVRWIGDDDSLEPDYVSRVLDVFAEDERRVVVTTQIVYSDADGRRDPRHRLRPVGPVVARTRSSGSRGCSGCSRPTSRRSTRSTRVMRRELADHAPTGTCCARTRSSRPGSRWPDPGDTWRRPSRGRPSRRGHGVRPSRGCSACRGGTGTSGSCCSARSSPAGSRGRRSTPRSAGERAPRSCGSTRAARGSRRAAGSPSSSGWPVARSDLSPSGAR